MRHYGAAEALNGSPAKLLGVATNGPSAVLRRWQGVHSNMLSEL